MVGFGFKLVDHFQKADSLSNNKSCSDQPNKRLAHKFFHAPTAVFIGNRMIFIGKQTKVKIVLLYKLLRQGQPIPGPPPPTHLFSRHTVPTQAQRLAGEANC